MASKTIAKKTAFEEGFFSVFGFVAEELSERTRQIFEKQPAEKMRDDLKAINSDFRNELNELKDKLNYLEF
jgi:hypothetical protein